MTDIARRTSSKQKNQKSILLNLPGWAEGRKVKTTAMKTTVSRDL